MPPVQEQRCEDAHSTTAVADEKDQGAPLTLEQLQKCLCNLGHNGYGEVTFTTVTLASKGLTSLEPLAGFPFLQRVSLDNNRLTSLEPLKALCGLVYLSARNNRLSERGVFPFLINSASSLERLHLDGNVITTLDGLAELPYLMDLSVSQNALTQLTASSFGSLRGLTRFNASRNRIASVDPNLFSGSRQIRVVDLSHNCLTNLHFVAYITTQLETLLLSHNDLSSLSPCVAECKSLVVLDIAFNAFNDVNELQVLRSAELLRQLHVTGNPLWIEEGVDRSSCSDPVSAACDDEGKSTGTASRGKKESASEEVVVQDAADLAVAARQTTGESTTAADEGHMDYTALTVPSAYGVVRHVLTATHMATVPWDLDRSAELAKLPAARQAFLQLVHRLPSLEKINETVVVPQDVARAAFFFANADPAGASRAPCS